MKKNKTLLTLSLLLCSACSLDTLKVDNAISYCDAISDNTLKIDCIYDSYNPATFDDGTLVCWTGSLNVKKIDAPYNSNWNNNLLQFSLIKSESGWKSNGLWAEKGWTVQAKASIIQKSCTLIQDNLKTN